jgi:hypothetical protein
VKVWDNKYVINYECPKCNNFITNDSYYYILSGKVEAARNAEASGRYEDAAKLWEELHCYEKAGSLRGAQPIQRPQQPSQLPKNTIDTSSTKFCRHCGKTIKGDSTFCEHCGKVL